MRPGWLIAAAIICAPPPVLADTPSSSVFVTPVTSGQSYPEVAANGEGWFDAGGFCKVVDVGDLSAFTSAASGIPVFVPGPTDQWENFRTLAGASYGGHLTLTTCCRPQDNITTLCNEAGAALVAVSREYGKLGETDLVSATCIDQWGATYTDSVTVACSGDNGPDGQAAWAVTGGDSTGSCTPDAYDTGCYAACDTTSTGTRYDSCGVGTNYSCSGGACPPPPPPPPSGGGSTTPTYCAPGTVYSSCTLQIYNCLDNPTGTYEDCGNECGATGINPSGIKQSTWVSPPACGNGTECQYGVSACCTNTPFTTGETTSYVCRNADLSASCPAPAFQC